MIDAILLDLFGTLVDFAADRLPTTTIDGVTRPSTIPMLLPIVREWQPVTESAFATALHAGSKKVWQEHGSVGREVPARERFRRALLSLGMTTDDADVVGVTLARRHHACLVEATDVVPGAVRVLMALAARWPIAIVSNFDDTSAAFRVLERHGLLGACRAVVISEAIGWRKPSPWPVQVALREVGATTGVLVGDTFDDDVGAARAAGIDAAWIDRHGVGVPAGSEAPRWHVRSLAEFSHALGV